MHPAAESAKTCAGRRARKAGGRELLLLLHGSAGSGGLWKNLQGRFSDLYEVMAPDLIGYGAAPAATPPFALEHETARIDDLLPCCERAFHVLGYSYGGAVALQLALANPVRIRTLTLVEPVFFAALRYGGESEALGDFLAVRARFAATLERGDREAALSDFLGFWTGSGSWDRLSVPVREVMLGMAGKIRLDWEAAFQFDPGVEALAGLAPRTLLLRGDRSPDPMLRLVDALHRLMPGSTRNVVLGADHLLPLTHSSQLAAALLSHLHASAERQLR